MYFFSRPYNYDSGVSASAPLGTTPPEHPASYAIDYNKDSYFENDHANTELVIDLGSAKTIDSVWIKHFNIDTFDIHYSDNGSSWYLVADGTAGNESGCQWIIDFTERTKRYWKITVTAKLAGGSNIYIYEAMFMSLRLNITDDTNKPADISIIPIDRKGGGYDMADGTHKTFSGQRLSRDIRIDFQNTPYANMINLYSLFSTPTIRPALTIIPDPDIMLNCFRIVWGTEEFNFKVASGYTGAGYNGTLEFKEY